MIRMLCLLVLGLSLATVTGCSRVTAGQVRRNMTPELRSTTRPAALRSNDLARITDNNLRGAWDDMDRFLLLNRNSHLTPWPVP